MQMKTSLWQKMKFGMISSDESDEVVELLENGGETPVEASSCQGDDTFSQGEDASLTDKQDTRKKRYTLWTWRLLLSQIDHRMFHKILNIMHQFTAYPLTVLHSLPTHIVLHTLLNNMVLHTLLYHMNLHSLHLLVVFPSLTRPVVLYDLSHSPLKHSPFSHNTLNHSPFSHKKMTTLNPRLTDYDTLLRNIHDLKAGKPVEIPIYDFKSSSRIGYRTLDVPSSRIVVIEGIYALSEKLRPLLDLRVSVTGGVHFDLVKRVLRDIQRAGQEPEEIIHQISETVYPMYKAFIEPDLQTAHIRIINKFNPFTGFQSPTYILKSLKSVTVDQIKAVMLEEHTETVEQTYDIYLLPPGEDPESCQSYLRMRNKDGKYNLMFEEWVSDSPFVISPRITFEVSVRLLGGLMALGYTIAAILKRSSHVFSDERVCVKIDWLEQLDRHYVQVQGKDRLLVKSVAEQLELEGSYVPRTYIEQIQLEKLVNEVMALPDDLKTKLSIDDDLVASPKLALSRASADMVAMRNKNLKSALPHTYSTQRDKNMSKLAVYSVDTRRFEDRTTESSATLASQGAIAQLSEQISTLNDRMDEFTSRIEELNSKLISKRVSSSPQNMALQSEACNGSAPTSYFISGLGNGSLTGSIMPNSLSSSQLAKEYPLMEEISNITRGQRQIMHQLDNLANRLCENLREKPQQARTERKSIMPDIEPNTVCLILTLAAGGLGIFLFKAFLPRN